MIKKIFTNTKGTYTLEAALILPLILVMLLSLVSFSLYTYQQLTTFEGAVYAAKQRAAAWDNSCKELETGSLGGTIQKDGLYWRLYRDFDNSPLALTKSAAASHFAAGRISSGLEEPGEILARYSNRLIKRNVYVTADADTAAGVAEPVEFIRNMDLAAEYGGPLLDRVKDFIDDFHDTEKEKPTTPVYATKQEYEGQDKVYHYAGCFHLRRIKPENLIIFNSPEEAVGYRLCLHCARRIASGYD